MFLRYIDYELSPAGASVYDNCWLNKEIYFEETNFDTVKQMEDLVNTLKLIKKNNNIDDVILDIEDKIDLRKKGLEYENEHRQLKRAEQEASLKRDISIDFYIREQHRKTDEIIDEFKKANKDKLSAEEINNFIHQEAIKCNSIVKEYIIKNYGEEEYNKRRSSKSA